MAKINRVLVAATGLAGFIWVMTSGTAEAGTVGGQSQAPRSGLSYWLFSLIGAVADVILVLLMAALVFTYLLLRRSPVDLHVRRSGRSGRSSGPGHGESGAGLPDDAVAGQVTAEPTELPVPPPDAQKSPGAETACHTRLAEVLLGGDRIRVTLAEEDVPELVTGLAAPHSQPYRHHLAWAPLPCGTPEDGIAFAFLGSSDRHCLFLDLGQAPSTVTIGGDPQAVTRLAASIAQQLCATSGNMGYTIVIIGDALPKPYPPTATWLASADRLGSALAAHPSQVTAIVFCTLGTQADAQTLADQVADARCRVVPVVLNSPLEGAWSIAATPVAEAGHGNAAVLTR